MCLFSIKKKTKGITCLKSITYTFLSVYSFCDVIVKFVTDFSYGCLRKLCLNLLYSLLIIKVSVAKHKNILPKFRAVKFIDTGVWCGL